jgi:hypothetical protein
MGLGWPWPRSLDSSVPEYLGQAGAKVVGLDLLFTERSNEAHDDEQFGRVVADALTVVSVVVLQRRARDESPEGLRIFSERQDRARPSIERFLVDGESPRFDGAALPIDPLLLSIAGFGNVTAGADRETPLMGAYLGTIPILSLPVALYAITHVADEKSHDWIKEQRTDRGGFHIRYCGPAQTVPTYSYRAVLSSAIRVREARTPQVALGEF